MQLVFPTRAASRPFILSAREGRIRGDFRSHFEFLVVTLSVETETVRIVGSPAPRLFGPA